MRQRFTFTGTLSLTAYSHSIWRHIICVCFNHIYFTQTSKHDFTLPLFLQCHVRQIIIEDNIIIWLRVKNNIFLIIIIFHITLTCLRTSSQAYFSMLQI